eukprot:6023872-Prymnesium_polylepis.3
MQPSVQGQNDSWQRPWQPSADEASCAKVQNCRIRYLTCFGTDLPEDRAVMPPTPATQQQCVPCRCVVPALAEVASKALARALG